MTPDPHLVQVVSAHRSSIEARPNVVGIAIGTKRIAGRDTGRPCVTVLVRRKLPAPSLPASAVIPLTIEGEITDVVEVGDVVAIIEVERQFHRPVVSGISCGPVSLLAAGTIGLPLVYKGTEAYLLSNTHVLAPHWIADPKGLEIVQPAALDQWADKKVCALVEQWTPIAIGKDNLLDAAIARLITPAKAEVLGLGAYGEPADPVLGMRVYKIGRTTSRTSSQVTGLDVSVQVQYPHGIATMAQQAMFQPSFAMGGDSGSLVLEEGSNRPVGLLFASSSLASFATPIKAVLNGLEVTLEPAGTPVKDALQGLPVTLAWGFDNISKAWSFYDPTMESRSTLKSLVPGRAYWFYAAEYARFQGQTIVQGWNLVQYKGAYQ